MSKKYSGESWSHHGKRPYRHVAAPDQRVVEELWLLEHAFHRRGAASMFRAPWTCVEIKFNGAAHAIDATPARW